MEVRRKRTTTIRQRLVYIPRPVLACASCGPRGSRRRRRRRLQRGVGNSRRATGGTRAVSAAPIRRSSACISPLTGPPVRACTFALMHNHQLCPGWHVLNSAWVQDCSMLWYLLFVNLPGVLVRTAPRWPSVSPGHHDTPPRKLPRGWSSGGLLRCSPSPRTAFVLRRGIRRKIRQAPTES